MDFFDRVKELVKSTTQFTLRAFVESLGLNYDSYNTLKRYGNLPRADEAVKIANALGTTVEYLVGGKAPARQADINEIKRKIRDFADSL